MGIGWNRRLKRRKISQSYFSFFLSRRFHFTTFQLGTGSFSQFVLFLLINISLQPTFPSSSSFITSRQMFSKIFASSAVILALAFQVNAHAAVMPVMGVANPVRADVKRPNDAAPCGRGVDIAAGMESSEVAVADANGQISGTIVNFNR